MDCQEAGCGYGLNVAEKAGLEMAMLQIRQTEKLARRSIKFWGRICGDTADYLMVCATLPSACYFPTKKFYYTTTRQANKLSQMPELSDLYAAHAASLVEKPFSGEPSLPYDIEGQEASTDEGVAVEIFREEHRLAYHVRLIDHDTCVVPVGAFLVDATHRVVENQSYQGLSYEAAGQLKSYLHFRDPESNLARKALEKTTGIVRPADFLDNISNDTPDTVISITYSPDNTTAILRNFYWPGAFAFHVINTHNFGSVYFGDGCPNLDLQFML